MPTDRPSRFDWRAAHAISPVKDQGTCNACVAFAIVAVLEAMRRICGAGAEALSEAYLFFGLGGVNGVTCASGWDAQAALDLCRQGIIFEADYHYQPFDQFCPIQDPGAYPQVRITGWTPLPGLEPSKAWLSTKAPLVASLDRYPDFLGYSGGIYRGPGAGNPDRHSVCVVGYDDPGGFWICKNSMGSNWGESGFFRIAYGQCGIDAQMWGIDGLA
jgi:C1A family cysteine protease